jgi:hypothetical protein
VTDPNRSAPSILHRLFASVKSYAMRWWSAGWVVKIYTLTLLGVSALLLSLRAQEKEIAKEAKRIAKRAAEGKIAPPA